MRFGGWRFHGRLWLVFCLVGAALIGSAQPSEAARSHDPSLDREIQERLASFTGKANVYAKNLDTGAVYTLRAEEAVRTASTIKLPIMVACFRAVSEGKARWDEQLPITEATKVSGSGVIREFADGTPLSLRDLMHVMIVISDNTATNVILDRIGADYVNESMADLGFTLTRSMRKIRGDGANLKAPTGWSREGEKEENKRFGIGRSSPAEMGKLLEMLESGKVVSPEGSKEMLAVLSRQQDLVAIGRRWADVPGVRVASKSGALDALRSDVGILYHPKGRLVVAITVDGMPKTDYSPDNVGNVLISDISGILVKHMLETSAR